MNHFSFGKLFYLLLFCSALHVVDAQTKSFDKNAPIQYILKEKLRPQLFKKLPSTHPLMTTQWRGGDELLLDPMVDKEKGEPFIAMHPTDSNILVVSFMEFDATGLEMPVYVSKDGGATFTRSAFSPATVFLNQFPDDNIGGGGDPVFAFDKNGRLYFAWLFVGFNLPTFTLDFVTMWAYSDDLGKTFMMAPGNDNIISAGNIDLIQGAVSGTILDRPWLAVDQTNGPWANTLYVAGFEYTVVDGVEAGGITVKRKLANQNTFENQSYLVQPLGYQFSNIQVDNEGGVIVTAGAQDPALPSEVRYARSVDGGITYPLNASIGSYVYDIQAEDSTRLVHTRENPAPSLGIGAGGKNLVAWSSFDGAASMGLVLSKDKGTTWKNLEVPGSNVQAFMPSVAMNKEGSKGSVGFYQLDANDVGNYKLRVYSINPNSTPFKEFTISGAVTNFMNFDKKAETPAFFGDYNSMVRNNCKTYMVWSDGRDGTAPRVYVGTLNDCTTGGINITPIQSNCKISPISPNPVTEEIHFTIESLNQTNAVITLVDRTGKVMDEAKIVSIPAKEAIQFHASVKTFIPGLYYVQIIEEGNSHVLSFVKN